MQNGQSFTAALTTDIDAGKIVAGAVVGAVVGGTLGAAAPALTTYGTVAVAQVQTTAVAAAAAHPTAAAVVGGVVETAVECSMTGGGCGAADYALGAVTAGAAHRLSTPYNRTTDRAATNPKNYTLRPNDVTGSGLGMSTYTADPQVVLAGTGRNRLVQIPGHDIPGGLTWTKTPGHPGLPQELRDNHWELWHPENRHSMSPEQYLGWWNSTIAPDLAQRAANWNEIR
jgi:hypothetical protein